MFTAIWAGWWPIAILWEVDFNGWMSAGGDRLHLTDVSYRLLNYEVSPFEDDPPHGYTTTIRDFVETYHLKGSLWRSLIAEELGTDLLVAVDASPYGGKITMMDEDRRSYHWLWPRLIISMQRLVEARFNVLSTGDELSRISEVHSEPESSLEGIARTKIRLENSGSVELVHTSEVTVRLLAPNGRTIAFPVK